MSKEQAEKRQLEKNKKRMSWAVNGGDWWWRRRKEWRVSWADAVERLGIKIG